MVTAVLSNSSTASFLRGLSRTQYQSRCLLLFIGLSILCFVFNPFRLIPSCSQNGVCATSALLLFFACYVSVGALLIGVCVGAAARLASRLLKDEAPCYGRAYKTGILTNYLCMILAACWLIYHLPLPSGA